MDTHSDGDIGSPAAAACTADCSRASTGRVTARAAPELMEW